MNCSWGHPSLSLRAVEDRQCQSLVFCSEPVFSLYVVPSLSNSAPPLERWVEGLSQLIRRSCFWAVEHQPVCCIYIFFFFCYMSSRVDVLFFMWGHFDSGMTSLDSFSFSNRRQRASLVSDWTSRLIWIHPVGRGTLVLRPYEACTGGCSLPSRQHDFTRSHVLCFYHIWAPSRWGVDRRSGWWRPETGRSGTKRCCHLNTRARTQWRH